MTALVSRCKSEKNGLTHSLDDVVDQLLGLVNLVLALGHDQAVEILLLVARMGSVRATLALLDGALATNGNLGTRVILHLLECVATRADE